MARDPLTGGRYAEPSVLILVSLADGPKHGYALTQDVRSFADVDLGPGTLYGALARLEQRGLIAPMPEVERQRPYAITASGRAVLADHLSALGRIAKVGSTRLATA